MGAFYAIEQNAACVLHEAQPNTLCVSIYTRAVCKCKQYSLAFCVSMPNNVLNFNAIVCEYELVANEWIFIYHNPADKQNIALNSV